MAKRKRGSEEEEEDIQYSPTLSNFEVYEVDKILQGGELRQTIVDRRSLPMPKVSKIKHAHKVRKLVTCSWKDKNMEDHLSRLPDDILKFIISLLTMREGAATSILSRRWRKLWSSSVSCLYFDDANLIGYTYPSGYFEVKGEEFVDSRRYHTMRISLIFQLRRFNKKAFLESERTKFIRRGNQIWRSVLRSCHASPVGALRVSFPLGKESASHVDKWMKLAAAQGVTQVDLDFNFLDFWCFGRKFDNAYKFPVEGFGSSLSYLSLRSCVFDFPPDFGGFSSLVSLSLLDTCLTNNSVQNMVCKCPCLKWLCLTRCKFRKAANLEFVGPSILLKHLAILGCNIKRIKVHDVNVLSLELLGDGIKVSIKNVPRLARLVLYTDGPVEILSDVPCLKTLFLEHEQSKLPELCVFNNLTRLVFSANNQERNLLEVVFFLEACPLLEQLEVDMGIFRYLFRKHADLPEESRRIRMRPGCPHYNLKEVVIHGFDCHLVLIELLRYLLRNASVLEKMKIHTTSKTYYGNGLSAVSKTAETIGMPLEKVLKLLQKEANPSTQIILSSQ